LPGLLKTYLKNAFAYSLFITVSFIVKDSRAPVEYPTPGLCFKKLLVIEF